MSIKLKRMLAMLQDENIKKRNRFNKFEILQSEVIARPLFELSNEINPTPNNFNG